MEYVLVRDDGCEGHSGPLLCMGEQDAHEFLLSYQHSHDTSLVIYRVPNLYDARKDPNLKTVRVRLADLGAA